ncbi:MAG: hypothetical protein NC406_06685 [Bacteroides sp.]|nr:hypothetical protein [Bacteroides sp.]MCM1096012.1 hypothetical protein [Terasakiella sp.]
MRKIYTAICLLSSLCLGGAAATAAEKPVEIEYSFDDDADFPGGADLPAGWAQQGAAGFVRSDGTSHGTTTHSGDKMIITKGDARFDEVLYTPMLNLVAGKPCTLEFYYLAPGGIPDVVRNVHLLVRAGAGQTDAEQTVTIKETPTVATKTWTKHSYTFTPEVDGEYCFSIALKPYMAGMDTQCGYAAFDSFIISGTVNEGGASITQDFENDADYPGVATLPAGWLSTGKKPYARLTPADLNIEPAAPSGKYVVGAIGPSCDGSSPLITPLFDVKAGEPASVAFKYYAVGDIAIFGYGFDIYAAPKQDTPLAEATKIGTIADDVDRAKAWMTSDAFTYTPEADGTCCFIVVPVNAYGYNPGGSAAFDDFVFTGVEPHVEAEKPEDPKPAGPVEAFELEYDFDTDADFPGGANLPEGWAQQGTPGLLRASAAGRGITNHSGDYVLITKGDARFDEVLYTPMLSLVGGKPCTLEFYFIAPGNNAAYNVHMLVRAGKGQTEAEQTIAIKEEPAVQVPAWTKYVYSFTPEADGDYCFSIALKPYMAGLETNCGLAAFDSFIISGTRYGEQEEFPEPDLEPSDDNLAECHELPLSENFSNPEHYDGSSMLPAGWRSTGGVTWVTANVDGLEAVSGTYYMIADHNTEAERDDKAYTPFVNLTAGTEYSVSYSLYIQGNDWNADEALYLPTLTFTVGTEQDAAFHAPLARTSERTASWVKCEHKFTPKVSGAYCFGFMLTGPVNSGWVCVDDVCITAPGLVARVEPAFSTLSLHSDFVSGSTHLYEGQPLQMVNCSEHAESYRWTIDGGASPDESTDENPAFDIPAPGKYTITLEATNSRGTRKTSRSIDIIMSDKTTRADQPLSVYNDTRDEMLQRGRVPVLAGDDPEDYVTGYTHYYFDLAQRYDLPAGMTLKAKQLTLWVAERKYRNVTSFLDDQRIKPMTVAIYGSKPDGTIDESRKLGEKVSTIGELMGSGGLGGTTSDPRAIEFDSPIEVSGTIYVAMHYDRSMEVVPRDATLGRSYIATTAVRHAHRRSTLYVKPIDTPALSSAKVGEWCPVDAIDMRQKGLGAYWSLWLSSYDPAGIESAAVDGGDFTAVFEGDNLYVGGTLPGDAIAVYTLGGACVARGTALDGSTTVVAVPALAPGMYIVRGGAGSAKAIKH